MPNYVQSSYTKEQPILMEGQTGSVFDVSMRSGKAEEKLNFGRGLVAFNDGYKAAAADKITFSADFTSGDVITGKVLLSSVNSEGVQTDTINTVSVTYASSHAATLAAVVTAIEAFTGINASGTGSSGRTITVVGNSGIIVKLYDWAAAGGAAPTVTYDMTSTFVGVSGQSLKEPDSNGDVYYKPLDVLNVAVRNDIGVMVDAAVSLTDVPYLRIVADSETNQGLGQFTTSANSSKAISLAGKARFVSETSGAGIVRLALLNV